MPYDWSTRWPGVFERHADFCPFSDGEMCTCGPLGYIAAIQEPGTGARVTSPMLDTLDEARAWRREQEWAVGPQHAAAGNGNGNGHRNGSGDGAHPRRDARPARTRPMRALAGARESAPLERGPLERGPLEPDDVVAHVGRQARRREPESTPRTDPETTVSALIEKFLDAAEDGQARGNDGRPYSDDELADLEWALTGYVGSHFGELSTASVRGRHVFKLIDELEDAGMPRSRLRSVVDALRELFDYAADLNLVRVNPATYVSAPAEERPVRRRLADTIETRAPRARGEAPQPFTDSMVSERTIWMLVKIVTLVFICIALVLVAESV